ncbi:MULTISPECIES: VOC family protein [Streptomyces]|uniref:VOC family protein n=1 Tax=Streptomyces chengmaiensis TaxID=3040919 RepID=A0ABT6HS00_9ACTN|nr:MULTISPECIES: VOC family protein [Streptomyces]MDH2390819.1 VOC family protein [Streptomyces chengmaiensis]WRQ80127.1 VOC family protein [Streptomyces sp. MUM 178J]
MPSIAVRRWAAGAAATTLLTVGLAAGAPAGAAPTTERQPTAVTTTEVRYGQPGLYARNIDTLMAFYRDGLGFDILYRFPETGPGVFGTVVMGDYYITVSTYDVVRQATGMQNIGRTWRKQSELVVIVADVDAAYKQALKAGAKSLMAPKDQPWGERSAYVGDPEGNLVQLSTHNE